jgi:hypothetical protein
MVRHVRGDGSSGGARCLQKTDVETSVAGSGNLSDLQTSEVRAQPRVDYPTVLVAHGDEGDRKTLVDCLQALVKRVH